MPYAVIQKFESRCTGSIDPYHEIRIFSTLDLAQTFAKHILHKVVISEIIVDDVDSNITIDTRPSLTFSNL